MRRNSIRTIVALLIFVASSLCVAVPGYAQTTGGTILGTMTDPSGAVVPGGKVVIKNMATNVERTVETNEAGFYRAPNLPPGTYQLTASAAGFRTQVLRDISLAVGAEQVVNLQMSVGEVSQQVEVAGGAVAVDLASSTLSHVVAGGVIRELPLNGRDWTQLATLQPGVAVMASQNTADLSRTQRGNGLQLTISGGRPSENNYRLNGISINDYANTGPGNALGANLGVDAIQEFAVLTSTYSAEYGKASGGVINAVTKSGTNALHGTAYYFHRNSALDAPNFLNQLPALRRHQFGSSVGGPIKKDRTFYFADYEGLREFKSLPSANQIVLSPAAREGRLTSGTVTVDPVVKPYLAIYPLPNAAISGDTGRFLFSAGKIVRADFVTGKVDQRFSEKDALNGTYLFDDAKSNTPDEFNNKAVSSATRRQSATLEESHLFSPQLFNTARIGFSRTLAFNGLSSDIFNPVLKDTSLGFLPGLPAGEIQVSGLTSFSGGQGVFERNAFWYTSYQVYDDLFVTRRSHSIKVGFGVERNWENFNAPNLPGGRFVFASIADFLTAKPTTLQAGAGLLGSDALRGNRQTVVGAYVQDDVRWRPNFTVNLGLRYEFATVPTEVNGKMANLVNLTDPAPTVGFYFKSTPKTNFAPRVGFAWDPFGKGKTSVRAGFGIFDILPLTYLFTNRFPRTPPFFGEATASGLQNIPGVFPKGGIPFLVSTGRSLRTVNIETDPHRSYKLQWNFNLQHELLPSLTVAAGYIGARGVHVPAGDEDVDIVLPGKDAQGYVWPATAADIASARNRRINTNFGRIGRTRWNANAFYHSLQTSVTKRLSRGIQIQGSYTWAKSIDTSTDTFSNNEYTNTIANPFPFDTKVNRGLSDFDIRHNFVLNFQWEIPGPKSGPAQWLLGGWQLGGIYQARTGVPFTPVLGANRANTGSAFSGQSLGLRPDLIAGPGCTDLINPGNPSHYIKTECFSLPGAGRLGNLGRGRLTNPGFSSFDFSVFKNHPVPRISESFKVQVRVEFFNLFNRDNLGLVQAAQYTLAASALGNASTANQIVGTSGDPREIQFGLKLIW